LTALPPHLRRYAKRLRARRLVVYESIAVIGAAVLLTLRAEWQILFRPLTFQPDAQLHTFWMRRFQDHGLFNDPLTHALIAAGYIPLGLHSVYLTASYLIDPVTFGPWLAVVLAPFSAFLVFRIVREHSDWIPAAWIGAAMFLLPVDVLRFSGGHARAFDQPIVLLTVYLLIRDRVRLASVVPAIGTLFYPPAAVSALAVLVASSLTRRGRWPALRRARAIPAAAGVLLTSIALLLPRLANHDQALISASQARALPDFGPNGQMHFFAGSRLEMLRGDYSGISTTNSLAIVLLTPMVLLLLRPSNIRLPRAEVLWMAVTTVILFALSYVVLFRLYLPNRYTYPLLPFSCIVTAVCWKPTMESLGKRLKPSWLVVPAGVTISLAIGYLAVRVVPFGPEISHRRFDDLLSRGVTTFAVSIAVGAAVCLVLWLLRGGPSVAPVVTLAAMLAAVVLLGEVSVAGGGQSQSGHCALDTQTLSYIASLPKSAVIAGDPTSIGCVTIVSERPVVISRKLNQGLSPSYLRVARARMFAMVEAYYGNSLQRLLALRTRFGADYLVVQPGALRARHPSPRWGRMAPFTGLVAELLRTQAPSVVLNLPAHCETWHDASTEVYDLRCIAATA
jgi:hypothetical protein